MKTINDWWIDFFNNESGEITLTSETNDAINTIFKLCKPSKNALFFDQCCGKGYLANEISKKDFCVVGVDASENYINFANANYKTDSCTFIKANAKDFNLEEKADIAINWHTSFGYDEDDNENIKMLKSLSDSLEIGGEFIIETFNPLSVINHFQKHIVNEISYQNSTIITIRESYIENKMLKSNWLIIYPDGKREKCFGQTKMYNLADFIKMLTSVGLFVKDVYGDMNLEKFRDDSPYLIIYGEKNES